MVLPLTAPVTGDDTRLEQGIPLRLSAPPLVDTPVPFEDAGERIVGRRASDVLAVHLDTVKVGEAQARSRGRARSGMRRRWRGARVAWRSAEEIRPEATARGDREKPAAAGAGEV